MTLNEIEKINKLNKLLRSDIAELYMNISKYSEKKKIIAINGKMKSESKIITAYHVICGETY